MREGIILKGVGGQYEVQVGDGVCLCTLRGRLRLEDIRVMVGDRVKVTVEGEQGVVEEILPRQSELIRPAIANIDQVVVVFAAAKPKPSLILLDRILVQAELARLDALLVINKSDLALEEAKRLQEMYGSIPYRTVIVSAKEGWGLDEVRQELTGKMSTLAGPSGVGKSSLLNALLPELELEVQSVSRKVQRGRHTTRTVTLLPLPDGGFVADTPGFSVLNLGGDMEAELQYAFPEMDRYRDSCQFRGCLHRREPNCAVKEAVEKKEILAHRYEHYLLLLQEAAPSY
ncbi:MAG: ribosome small subunit-dependent GTPase A [Limnochordia bacterium]|jgi:ribosome biogenesis GTPase